MKAYALKRKSDGAFLPYRKAIKGFTADEPKKDCIPRLFTSVRAAQLALNWWLKGAAYLDNYGGLGKPYFREIREIKIEPKNGRKPDDMEIVEVAIQEVTK